MAKYGPICPLVIQYSKYSQVYPSSASYDQLWSSKTNMAGMAKYGHDMIIVWLSMTNYA
jgi:hypothetical protein